MEEYLPNNTKQHQIGESSIGAQGLVPHAQPVVEVPHGYTGGFVGSSGRTKQAEETIRCASLGQIRVDYSREEASGLQGDGYGSLGEPPDPEIDPDYGSSEEMRCTSELQRGYSRHLEVYDGLETRLGCIQGASEGDGVEYGGSSGNEC